jgi:hypothetical protein
MALKTTSNVIRNVSRISCEIYHGMWYFYLYYSYIMRHFHFVQWQRNAKL